MAENPLVFVSYSHDSQGHKIWVADLAKRLLSNGVDVILDQWDLRFGDDVPKFMERSVRDAHRVLMICTDAYVQKSNEGKGGVGYEAMVVSSELIRDLGTSKFIPIIKQDAEPPSLPNSVGTRFYIDLSKQDIFDSQYDALLRELHSSPVTPKPPLGKNPFSERAAPIETMMPAEVGKETGEVGATTPSSIYQAAQRAARSQDFLEWRKLIQVAKRDVGENISRWRASHENHLPSQWSELLPIASEGVATHCPLIAIALAGVESANPKFNQQVGVLDDILFPRNWNRSGQSLIVDFPVSLAFVYQGLHGAVAMSTGQHQLAIGLLASQVELPGSRESMPLWKHHDVMGWPDAFEGKATTAWKLLVSLGQSWPWLLEIFGDESDFVASLCAYYMLANYYEFIDALSDPGFGWSSDVHLEVPICYESSSDDDKRRAYRLLSSNVDYLRSLWRIRGIKDEVALARWPSWVSISEKWLRRVYSYGFRSRLTHAKLLSDLLPG